MNLKEQNINNKEFKSSANTSNSSVRLSKTLAQVTLIDS